MFEGPRVPSSFNEAVNTSRFVKSFGITALIYSLISVFGMNLLGGGIGAGVGLFIIRYDKAKFYRILGIVVIIFAFLGALIPFLGSGVLSGAVMWKGIQAFKVLSKEGRNEKQSEPSRKRVTIGIITSGIGLLISILLMYLFSVGLMVNLLGGHGT